MGFLDKSARLPEENSLNSTRVPKSSHVLRNLSSVLGTGVAFYKYGRLRYSPLRTLRRVLLKHVPDRAETQVVQEEVLDKALLERHSRPGESEEFSGALARPHSVLHE